MTQDCFVRPADPDMCYLLRCSSWHQSLVRLHLFVCYSGYSLHSVLCVSEHFLQTFSRSTESLLFQCCSWWILSFDENFSGLCFSRSLGISALVCCCIVRISSWCKQPQMCLGVVGADEQVHSLSKKKCPSILSFRPNTFHLPRRHLGRAPGLVEEPKFLPWLLQRWRRTKS